jgi:hypothetical protein
MLRRSEEILNFPAVIEDRIVAVRQERPPFSQSVGGVAFQGGPQADVCGEL